MLGGAADRPRPHVIQGLIISLLFRFILLYCIVVIDVSYVSQSTDLLLLQSADRLCHVSSGTVMPMPTCRYCHTVSVLQHDHGS